MENLSKEELLDILGKIDFENTKIKTNEIQMDSIEKPKSTNNKTVEEINSSELTAKGKPRKRTITPKQLETFRENGQKRSELAKIKKQKEQELLEELKAEEEAKIKEKLARKAREKVLLEVESKPKATKALIREKVVEPIAAAPVYSAVQRGSLSCANTTSTPQQKSTSSVSLSEYLRGFGL